MTNNLKAFKALITRYESITLEEIQKTYCSANVFTGNWGKARKLTGFGSIRTCTLCKAINMNCDKCMWTITTGDRCGMEDNKLSYYLIEAATDDASLLFAFRNRARYMQQVLKEYEESRPGVKKSMSIWQKVKRFLHLER